MRLNADAESVRVERSRDTLARAGHVLTSPDTNRSRFRLANFPEVRTYIAPLGEWMARQLRPIWGRLAIFLIVALVVRISTFGDPNLHPDETFYLLVGHLMHQGELPYVDVWDRKPLGLFIIYYFFAAFPNPVIAYQIGAWLCTAVTALVISEIVTRWVGLRGGVCSGLVYILMLGPLHGFGGQSPVYYNALIALAGLLVILSIPELKEGQVSARVYWAMLAGGCAITVKQTAFFESAFFGLFVAVLLFRSLGMNRKWFFQCLALSGLGLLPSAFIIAAYILNGHFFEFYHAMVTSNFVKPPPAPFSAVLRCYVTYLSIWVPLLTALSAMVLVYADERRNEAAFFILWMVASIIGFVAVPNFYQHYALPLAVTISILAGYLYNRRILGGGLLVAAAGSLLYHYNPTVFVRTKYSIASMDRLATDVKETEGNGGLFVFDGPPLLYYFVGEKPPSPLAFPMHFNHALETDASHLKTHEELARVLGRRPGSIVMSVVVRNLPADFVSRRMVRNYVDTNCRLVDLIETFEILRTDLLAVYGNCNKS